MDPVANPYSPGAGIRPRELAGRDEDLARFDILMQRASDGLVSRSIVLSGLRGVGKTVLLYELATRAQRAGWVVGQVEAGAGRRPLRQQVALSLYRALREATGSWGSGERIRRALSTFKSFSLRTNPSGDFAIGIEIDPQRGRADTGSLEVDLVDLSLDLADAASSMGVGTALFIDEMQDLDADEMSAICQACHEAGQRNAQFYVVGGGLPSLPRVLAEARSYAERLFEYRTIGALDRAGASAALTVPAHDAGATWDDAATALVVDRSAGFPYFLQEFGKAAWDFAPGPGITRDDAATGIRIGIDSLDHGFFRSRWERATPAERSYMRAMSRDGDRPAQSGEVAERLGRRQSSLAPARASLIHKGLVYAPEHGQVAFTVPGMAEFIDRQPE
jgi:hypothetical protein